MWIVRVSLVALGLLFAVVACGEEVAPGGEATGGSGGEGGGGGTGGTGGTGETSAICGDGLVQGGETCDPGAAIHPDCTADCSYVGAPASPATRCSLRGARNDGMVCLDFGAYGLVWFYKCETTDDCPSGFDICSDREAGGPVRVCLTNGCGPSSLMGANTNGAYWEACNTVTGVLDGKDATGICKPYGTGGICWRTGSLPAGSACKEVGGLDGKIVPCDASSTCVADPVLPEPCTEDADCVGHGPGAYCGIDRICRREGICAPTCNSGAGAGGPSCAGGLPCRDDYSMFPTYPNQPGSCGDHPAPVQYRSCAREGIVGGFECMREPGNTGRGVWVKRCESSSECTGKGDICWAFKSGGASRICWQNTCGTDNTNGTF